MSVSYFEGSILLSFVLTFSLPKDLPLGLWRWCGTQQPFAASRERSVHSRFFSWSLVISWNNISCYCLQLHQWFMYKPFRSSVILCLDHSSKHDSMKIPHAFKDLLKLSIFLVGLAIRVHWAKFSLIAFCRDISFRMIGSFILISFLLKFVWKS